MITALNSFYKGTVQPVFDYAQPLIQTVDNQIVHIIRTVDGTLQKADKKFVDYTNSVFSRPIALITQTALRAMPFIVLAATTPVWAQIGVSITYIAYKYIAYTNNPEHKQPFELNAFKNAQGAIALYQGFYDTGTGIISSNHLRTIQGIFKIACGALIVYSSHFLQDLTASITNNTTQETKETNSNQEIPNTELKETDNQEIVETNNETNNR